MLEEIVIKLSQTPTFPGFGGGPSPPKPLPPPPTREDPAIKAARTKQENIRLRKKGRQSTILNSGNGLEDVLGIINRPEAQGKNRLGG